MRYLLIVLLCAICSVCEISTALSEEGVTTFRSIEALKSLGVRRCVAALTVMTTSLYEKEDVAYLNTWNKDDTDKHIVSSLTAKPYSDGTSIAALSASPTPSETCDTHFVQVFVLKDSCAKVRETAFKEWKYYSDLGSTPLYEDPASSSVVAALSAVQGGGCLVFKTGVLFFNVDKSK